MNIFLLEFKNALTLVDADFAAINSDCLGLFSSLQNIYKQYQTAEEFDCFLIHPDCNMKQLLVAKLLAEITRLHAELAGSKMKAFLQVKQKVKGIFCFLETKWLQSQEEEPFSLVGLSRLYILECIYKLYSMLSMAANQKAEVLAKLYANYAYLEEAAIEFEQDLLVDYQMGKRIFSSIIL